MPLLDSLLAFILIVFAVSMVVSVLVQVFLDSRQSRRNYLVTMLSNYYDEGLVPAVRRRLDDDNYALSPEGRKELDRFLTGTAGFSQVEQDKLPAATKDLVEIDDESFKARLGASSVGKEIEQRIRDILVKDHAKLTPDQIQNKVDAFFAELALIFEVFGNRASNAFRRRARSVSIFAGVLLAFALNIDGLYMLRSVIGDASVRASIVTLDKELVAGLKKIQTSQSSLPGAKTSVVEFQKTVKGLQTKLGEIKVDDSTKSKEFKNLDDSVQALSARVGILSGAVTEAVLSPDEQQTLKTAIASADIAVGGRLPIGWEFSPFCWGEDSYRCPHDRTFVSKTSTIVSWFVGCLFMGLLAGLGAPFWHDMIKAVARARKTVRDPQSAAK